MREEEADYVEINTPDSWIGTLWEKSGHWEKFRENMFTAQDEGDKGLALKPMNCPGHVQVFKQGIKSYRDLPMRIAEFLYRNEPSGALHGLMRVRAFTQDDAHIACTEDRGRDEALHRPAVIHIPGFRIRRFRGQVCRPSGAAAGPTRSGTAPRKR